MKYFVNTLKMFAFANLLFVPSIATVLILAHFIGQTQTWWFAIICMSVLIGNMAILFSKKLRGPLWRKFNSIGGGLLKE